jgi:hypothetical protein
MVHKGFLSLGQQKFRGEFKLGSDDFEKFLEKV